MNSDEIHQNENPTDEDQNHENTTLQNSNQEHSPEENEKDGSSFESNYEDSVPCDHLPEEKQIGEGQPGDFQSSENLTSEQRVCEKIRASDVEKLNELRKNMKGHCIPKTPPVKDNGTDADDHGTPKTSSFHEDITDTHDTAENIEYHEEAPNDIPQEYAGEMENAPGEEYPGSYKTLSADENAAEFSDNLIEINIENDENLTKKFEKYFDKFDYKPREECKLTYLFCTIYDPNISKISPIYKNPAAAHQRSLLCQISKYVYFIDRSHEAPSPPLGQYVDRPATLKY
ncbi:hypothetical protein ACTXT7_012790 [Hymenolepis weldensis]